MSCRSCDNASVRFAAVRTTGIYCRAECSARPNPRNVEHFPNAVAAESAGFRPCLRCRPDRLPDLTGVTTPAPVEQALLLISEGFLDRKTEDELAAMVGYSNRQLRRLFSDSIGASPSAVARSRRAHFARRLLDESDLPISAIGRAAGFSSTRQMNRVMLDTFRFTPSQLRQRRTKHRADADGGLHLTIPFDGQLAWEEALAFLDRRAIPGIEAVNGSRYRRLTTTCGFPGVVEVMHQTGTNELRLTAHLATFNSIIDDVARIRRLFGLDRPPLPAQWPVDDDLAPLVSRRPGLRVPGAWDPFETAIRILLGQQISVSAATTLSGRLVEQFGTQFEIDAFGLSRQFPTPAVLADAPLEDIGLPGSRARSIRYFAAAVSSGELDLRSTAPLDEVIDELQRLPGIGPWTAQLIALRVMRHPDAFPASDLGLRIAVGRIIGEHKPPAKAVERFAEKWRPHRATAAQHLWASLDDKE